MNIIGIIDCINEDFADFCNPNYLTYNEDIYVTNTKYGFKFNHETPFHANHLGIYLCDSEKWESGQYHYVANNFENFILRYNKRIQSFKNYLNNPNNFIIFVIQFIEEENINEDSLDNKNSNDVITNVNINLYNNIFY